MAQPLRLARVHQIVSRSSLSYPKRPTSVSRSHLFYATSTIRPCRTFQTGSAPGPVPAGFEYKIAVAFSGKTNVFDRNKHFYLFDSETGLGGYGEADLAKRGRKIPSGQDSFFVAPVGDYQAHGYEMRNVAFGVADGVGGYKDSGIDSANFAHGICKYMSEAAGESEGAVKPLDVLQEGYHRVCADKNIEGGGSTACVAVAGPKGALDVAKSVI